MKTVERDKSRACDQGVVEIVCATCGARYGRLPAFTCPRCGTPLCGSGCEGCTAACGSRKRVSNR